VLSLLHHDFMLRLMPTEVMLCDSEHSFKTS